MTTNCLELFPTTWHVWSVFEVDRAVHLEDLEKPLWMTKKVHSKQQTSVPKLPALPPSQPVCLRSCAIQGEVTSGRAVGQAAFDKKLGAVCCCKAFQLLLFLS